MPRRTPHRVVDPYVPSLERLNSPLDPDESRLEDNYDDRCRIDVLRLLGQVRARRLRR